MKMRMAIIGCGSRGKDTYAECQKRFPDEMEIVAAVDKNPTKLLEMQEKYGVPSERCYTDADEFLSLPRMGEVACISTLDHLHYEYAVKAMKAGYHLLLEKPISPRLLECRRIQETAEKYNRHVVVCHVLRYTPFYRKIKECLASGVIGDIVSIQASEGVSYWHQAHSFVRGNWRKKEETSPMILQKCCHDFDILLWLGGKHCKRVSSFGDLRLFQKSNAPTGAPKRCTDGCPHAESCLYNAPRYYLGQLRDGNRDWPVNVLNSNPTEENIMEELKRGPYGRCVYYCDNDVVDHQVVNLQMEDGTTIDFTMCAFTKENSRRIRIMGCLGEIEGDMGRNRIFVRPFQGEDTEIDVNALSKDFSGHGGGDVQMMRELIDLILDDKKIPETITTIQQSMESHYIAFAAEESRMHHGKVIDLEDFVGK
ncbi:MAG TPA: Gfo/Idh/MocA family oxidoreductase [Candidatus Choladousia intestinavium]|uniref:Gfo/Idh/MocA family oxidoreductase n=1 Tax=Candidatus Choladousia intestinavium TaxID=2840727 RepID=A0A9D1ACF7_9FIRM|nr:Gfo/Idh/MocA family oxidoreductase [Candidatus Choladousia intestinavium]